MTTRKLQYKAVNDTASSHVGQPGDIFYDPAVAELRMYDGNPGGMTIGGGGSTDLTTVTSHILPAADLTYDLGSTSSQWRSLYVGTSTIYIGGTPVSVSGGSLTVGGSAIVADQTAITSDVLPAIGEVYNIGAPGFEWYNGYFSNGVNLADTSLTGAGTDLTISATDIITDSNIVGNSLLLDDMFLEQNVITPLSTPLYGQREIIVEGGLTVASQDPAYLKLTQLSTEGQLPAVNETWTFPYNQIIDDGGRHGYPGELWFAYDAATVVGNSANLVPGITYDIIAKDSDNNIIFSGSRVYVSTGIYIISESYTAITFESTASDAELYDTRLRELTISASASISSDYSVLDTYGSEGMIRFHPVTKEFEGHDGTAWNLLRGTDIFVSRTNIGSCLTGSTILGLYNNVFGKQAGLGLRALAKDNNFFGRCAGYCNNMGCHNNFFGQQAGFRNTNGSGNNFFGYRAGFSNLYGNSNTFIGYQAGYCNTSGDHNNFLGSSAGRGNTYGCHNNFLGSSAGSNNTTGSLNIFLGCNSGFCNTTGSNNNFFGPSAGFYNTIGCHNNFVGRCAGYRNTTGCYNTFIGNLAGFANTTGSCNNFIGTCAGYTNTTGSHNNFFGPSAGFFNITGCNNNFFGLCAGRNNTTGSYNNFIGLCAGICNTTGSYNNFFGHTAGFANTTGSHNNFIGHIAGRFNTTGSCNNFFGHSAGFDNTTGCHNNFIGTCAGCNNTVGSNNLLFGCCAGVGAVGLVNITTECNRIIMGNSSHTCAQIQVAWSVVSDCRDKLIHCRLDKGRDFLSGINPIVFSFKDRETNEITDTKKRYGFVAQEVLQLEGDDPVIVSDENPEKLNLTTDYIIPILVNGFKELSDEVKQLRAEIELLKN